jgi:hypothetical protein
MYERIGFLTQRKYKMWKWLSSSRADERVVLLWRFCNIVDSFFMTHFLSLHAPKSNGFYRGYLNAI